MASTLDLLTFLFVEDGFELELQIQDDDAQKAFGILAKELDVVKGRFRIKSEIPIGAGLGSSASFCVCIAAGLLLLSGKITTALKKADLDIINKYAYVAEQVIHGTCSGLDNTICTYGGYKLYDQNSLQDFDFGALKFMLINTKAPKSTKDQVAKFKNRLETYPKIMEPLLVSMGAIPSTFIEMFVRQENSDEKDSKKFNDRVQELIQVNQGLLVAAGMSNPVIDDTVAALNSHGFQTKITGSGGGGCLLAFLNGLQY